MSIAERQTPDWDALIEHDRVHGSLYTDPAVYAAELERIWYRTWVYVGHVSEIPEPNDYVVKSIGPQPIIMSRDKSGEIHLLLNRCTHRANLVCDAAKGNSSAFRCPYHGWTFSNTGQLLGYPFNSGYGGREAKKDLGLGRVPRIGVHQGFVFGSFAEDGPSLMEHLGAAAEAFDRLVALSPTGEVALTAGWLQHEAKANWKMLLENETDGYHPQFVHSSIFSVAKSGIGDLYGEKSTAVSRDLGGGHTENDLRPEFRRIGQPLGWFGTRPEKVPDYVAQMEARHGVDGAREILIDGAPHVMLFPNLFIAEIQLFVIQPTAVDETVQHVTAVQFPGCDDMNRRLLQQTIGSVGPAGFLLADDTEMYERNQRGVQARSPEWLQIKRGTHRERRDENGFLIGDATDEVPQRGIWRHYRELMED
ncbi:Rieske 2Fe-2S domain-containing protein [Conexibacter sp. W3-3-2]|uniref:aromatic ring-hydroxylating oxygenase subunit alpha n=1 Tax=Conexibacter sp. W3-3-2 TaxID=2675227 RepID=UPI0012B97704|nr:aromatic ring-hydroxylating dioxygenase subunit alpha [Conexibacter sp. W3-3-2]MTD44674.1 Rieske 2Fe-2S domain-containing protein [Conexibacter sp. W3-3-2]